MCAGYGITKLKQGTKQQIHAKTKSPALVPPPTVNEKAVHGTVATHQEHASLAAITVSCVETLGR